VVNLHRKAAPVMVHWLFRDRCSYWAVACDLPIVGVGP
jgi:hypothetical protein